MNYLVDCFGPSYLNGYQIIQIQLSNRRRKVKKYQKLGNKTFLGGGGGGGGVGFSSNFAFQKGETQGGGGGGGTE